MPRRSAASFVIPSVTGAPPRLSPPADLSETERAVFIDLVASSKAEHFRPSDLPLLSAYCRCIVLERRSAQELAAGDHKALARWEKATKAMVALSMRLRLSPKSRAPNNPSRPSQPEPVMSYYDRMELEGRDESS
jgi:phage terminase small subunit